MQISSFTYFLAVADTGSVRKAATNLHVSASAISRQIKNLEYSFKCTLFERRISGMVLTEEGKIIAQHMQRTMREMELAEAEVNEINGLLSGSVSFASIEGVISSWLLPAMNRFQSQHPNIYFDGRISASEAVYDAVASDQVDFGIAMQDIPRVDIEIIEKFATGFKAAMSPNHSLASFNSLTLPQLTPHPLSMLNDNFLTRQLLNSIAIQRQLDFTITCNLDHIGMLKSFVLESNGITILPDYAVTEEIHNGNLVIADISEQEMPKSITVLCVKKDRRMTKAAEKFLNIIRHDITN
ncbi:LysR family transcriptional regulator [Psychromonas sp. 14N.309.X.WAT.B.A12]|uniref:LysR family transcriptional regulator n=1 Tax=unclassified Psychromonas TaxID=2614957 RepID=UPI0025AF8E19|nr:LysR family transcriptional regulator [Psychromonas sp. 14N.309.X.WAT.B.A12]MDN2663613.1 LysR family transcriptional regulator [Psychromonas sp. 14N.309.X.WAT.B.A12]